MAFVAKNNDFRENFFWKTKLKTVNWSFRFGEPVRKHVPYKPVCLPRWNRSYEESEPPKNLTVVNISQDYKLQVSQSMPEIR